MPHVLIIANEVIGARMAGPGIRAWEIARALATRPGPPSLQVTLAIPPHVPRPEAELRASFPAELLAPDEAGLLEAAAAADVVFTQGFVVQRYPALRQAARVLALDMYDPFVLEGLEQYGMLAPERRWEMHVLSLESLNEQLQAGDFFVCASEKQRDYWLGMLTALGRVNPDTYAGDPGLERLIAVVPFGLPAEPLRRTRRVLKGVWPGIGADDRVILWHGGIWNWLDPFTLIRAMLPLEARRPAARLFFMGTRHPNPQMPYEATAAARQAQSLATELGLVDRTVFFNKWVDYAERGDYLLEADVSAMTYGDHVETRFAFRTRAVDAIYAGLPLVCTRGDALAELVERHGLGYTVAPGDVLGLADALAHLLDEPDARAARASAFRALAATLTWERVVEPLAAFLSDPRPAADRLRQAGSRARLNSE